MARVYLRLVSTRLAKITKSVGDVRGLVAQLPPHIGSSVVGH